jgi:hypothetical protein
MPKMSKIEVSLRSIFFLIGLFKIDPPQSAGGGLNIQYSIENIQSSACQHPQ